MHKNVIIYARGLWSSWSMTSYMVAGREKNSGLLRRNKKTSHEGGMTRIKTSEPRRTRGRGPKKSKGQAKISPRKVAVDMAT